MDLDFVDIDFRDTDEQAARALAVQSLDLDILRSPTWEKRVELDRLLNQILDERDKYPSARAQEMEAQGVQPQYIHYKHLWEMEQPDYISPKEAQRQKKEVLRKLKMEGKLNKKGCLKWKRQPKDTPGGTKAERMFKLPQDDEMVNPLITPDLPKSVNILFRAIASHPGNHRLLKNGYLPGNPNSANDWAAWLGAQDKNCPHHLPHTMQEKKPAKSEVERERDKPADIYPELAACARAGRITNNVLKLSMRTMMNRIPMIQHQLDDGRNFYALASSKGTKHYAHRRKNKLGMVADALDALPGTSIMMTLTTANQGEGHDMETAWKQINKERLRFIKLVKRHYNIAYVWAIEAHKTGYPHIHIVIKFIDQTIPSFVHSDGSLRIADEQLRDFLVSAWNIGHSHMVVAKDNQVARYVVKYIAKGISMDELDAQEYQPVLTPSERKNLMGLLLSTLFSQRMFGCSQGLAQPHVMSREPYDSDTNEKLLAAAQAAASGREARCNLIALYNNLLADCRSRAIMASDFDTKDVFRGLLDTITDGNGIRDDAFARCGHCMGCPGCILTQICDENRSEHQGYVSAAA